jgi:peptide/nickel transport system substrate-binding protein
VALDLGDESVFILGAGLEPAITTQHPIHGSSRAEARNAPLNRGKIWSTNCQEVALKVFLAGRVAVEANGLRIDEERFPGRQGRLVFAYLVAEEGRPVPHDELAEAVWGDTPPATWEKALSVVVSKLRALLAQHDADGGRVLTGAFGCYRVNLPAGTWIDVVAAVDGVGEAEAALAAGDPEQAKGLAGRAASLARRPFLPGEKGTWVEAKRRELADVLRRALGCLSEACLRLGHDAEAARWAEETIALEPYREAGYRRLMAAHAAAGNPAEGLRVYESCRRLLSEELGAYPSPETEAIYRELLGGSAAAVRAASPKPRQAAVVESESEQQAQAVMPVRRFRGPGMLIGIGAAVLMAAAIAVAVTQLTDRGHRTLHLVAANSLVALDSGTNRLVADIGVGAGPTGVAVDEGAVWVANRDDHTVSRIDLRTKTVRQTVRVGGGPTAVAVGAGAVWVANGLDGTVSRIDPKTNEVVETIRVGNTPTAIAFGDGAVWVANADDRTVSRIDPASGHVLLTLPVDAPAPGIAVGGGAVWLTDPIGNALVRLDTRTHTVTRVNVGSGPTAVAFGGGAVWTANNLDGTVSRVDADHGVVTDTVQVGVAPNGIAVTRDAVWVTDEAAGTLVRLNPRSHEATRRQLGGRPEGLTIADGSLWVAVQAAGAGHRGGTLRLLLSDWFDSIDPARAYTPQSWLLMSVTGDGLVGFKRVGGVDGHTLVPDLATALPVATDGGRMYAFRLREGLRFSNGRRVNASDVRYTFERLFKARTPLPDVYQGIIGGRACRNRPRGCDLSRGIVSDNASRMVTFHLRAPDPEFLDKLALPLATIVPAGTPAVGEHPLAGTGPYRIERYVPKRLLRLVRNPHFRVWSRAAQPDGNPDAIEFRFSSDEGEQVTAVERGRADWRLVPDNRLEEVRTRYAAQVHITPLALTVFVRLNTTQPPFDSVLARRALNYALDRARIVELVGGSDLAAPTCQILPPNFPGYRPYCPYAVGLSRGHSSSAPNLARARELVKRSGTSGMRVDLIVGPGKNVYTAGAAVVAATLRQLGYRVVISRFRTWEAFFAAYRRQPHRVDAATFGWLQDYPAASVFIVGLFSCNSYFCDRAFEGRMQRALALQARDPVAANEQWARLERELVDRAVLVPLVIPKQIDFVSRRVGNYQHHPVLGVLISQLWVR